MAKYSGRTVDEHKVASANWQAFERAYQGRHSDYVEEANKFSDFYNGEQWDPKLRTKLEAEGKPVLTINVAKKTLNTVLGVYANSRADIVFKPKKDASEEQARVMTMLCDHILASNKFDYVEKTVALDGWVMDRGFFDCRIDFDDNVLGEVRITSLDPRDVVLDPDAKEYDPDTWSEVHVIKWMSLSDVAELYGQEAGDKISSYVSVNGVRGTYGSDSIRFGTRQEESSVWTPSQDDAERIRAVRVIERQYKKMAKVEEFVDLVNGDTRPIPLDWDDAKKQQVADTAGLVIRSKMKQRIRWTVTVDHCVLHDKWSPYDCFTVVPYFPYFLRGYPSGIMRDLVSPQEQLNKTESQELHIINTTANSGWMVQAGSLVNMTHEELEDRGAETGLVVVYGANRDKPEKIQPNTIPTGIERIAQKSFQYITEIPGVAPLAQPQLKSDVSGVAYNRASDNALSTLRTVFDNLDYTRDLLADRIVRLVQQYYTEPRLFRITDWRNPEQQEVDVAINTSIVNTITLGEYDIIATSAPAQDTQEEREFAQIIEMKKVGVESIPDYHVVLASNLKNKIKIAEETKKAQGLAEPSPEEQQLQQQIQEMQMRAAQAEISEIETKAQQHMADAGLAQAKSQQLLQGEQREQMVAQIDSQLDQARLQLDAQKHMSNLQNKVQLAQIHAGTKSQLTQYQHQMKGLEAEAARFDQSQQRMLEIEENSFQKDQDRTADMLNSQLDRETELMLARIKARSQNKSSSKG